MEENKPAPSKIIDPNANRPRLIGSVNEAPPPTLEDIVTEAMHSVAATQKPRFFNMTVDSPTGPIPVTLVVMPTPQVQIKHQDQAMKAEPEKELPSGLIT